MHGPNVVVFSLFGTKTCFSSTFAPSSHSPSSRCTRGAVYIRTKRVCTVHVICMWNCVRVCVWVSVCVLVRVCMRICVCVETWRVFSVIYPVEQFVEMRLHTPIQRRWRLEFRVGGLGVRFANSDACLCAYNHTSLYGQVFQFTSPQTHRHTHAFNLPFLLPLQQASHTHPTKHTHLVALVVFAGVCVCTWTSYNNDNW